MEFEFKPAPLEGKGGRHPGAMIQPHKPRVGHLGRGIPHSADCVWNDVLYFFCNDIRHREIVDIAHMGAAVLRPYAERHERQHWFGKWKNGEKS